MITDNDKCTNIFADKTCDNFAPSDPKIIATLEKAGVTSSFNQVANIKGPISLKYDAKITKNQTSGIYTATFTINGKEQKETFKLLGTAVDPCDEKTLDLGNVTKAGETIILNGCSIVPGIT